MIFPKINRGGATTLGGGTAISGGGTPDTQVAERRSGPFRLNLTTGLDETNHA